MTAMGLETEYGVLVTGLAPGQPQPDPITLSEWVVGHVEATGTRFDHADEHPLVDARGTVLPRHLAHPDLLTDEVRHANRMLGNGGRSYVDHAHPEWSGPECATATEALVWDRAGDLLHSDAAARASTASGLRVHLVKNTTDNKGHSYGSHENHLLPRSLPFAVVVEQFSGFLASRVVVTGAGRVGLGQAGERPGFQTSQRADFFERLVGLETTVNRPLVNSRDEPHADAREHRRLHVITGDATLCQVATLVRIGSAHLVLQAIARGVRQPRLLDPLAAMKAWSRDPSCTLAQPCDDGVPRTAVQYQQLWARACEDLVGQQGVIADAALVLHEWQGILDDLAADPRRCADRLDWVAKLRLLEGLRERHGLGWDDPRLDALDLRWADLGDGLFSRLEASGAVRRLVGEHQVQRALREPPPGTRAWLRGTLLHRFAGQVAAANWDRISFQTPHGVRTLHLASPLVGGREQWQARLEGLRGMADLVELGDSLGWSTAGC